MYLDEESEPVKSVPDPTLFSLDQIMSTRQFYVANQSNTRAVDDNDLENALMTAKTRLHVAVEEDDRLTVSKLLTSHPEFLSQVYLARGTPVDLACYRGREEILDLFLHSEHFSSVHLLGQSTRPLIFCL